MMRKQKQEKKGNYKRDDTFSWLHSVIHCYQEDEKRISYLHWTKLRFVYFYHTISFCKVILIDTSFCIATVSEDNITCFTIFTHLISALFSLFSCLCILIFFDFLLSSRGTTINISSNLSTLLFPRFDESQIAIFITRLGFFVVALQIIFLPND